MNPRSLSLFLAIGLLAIGCASAQVVSQYDGGPLPRPDRVLVYDFAYSPGQVKLDRGISAQVADAMKSEPRSVQELEAGHQVAEVISEHLVKAIRDMGLPAQRAFGPAPPTGNTLAVDGQLISIDEGNRTERMVIGLGAGRTTVEAHVQVYQDTIDGQQLLERLDATGKSSRKPGMAETMGIGGAMGNLAVAAVVSTTVALGSEALSADVEADAARLAGKVADQLKTFFQGQGWTN